MSSTETQVAEPPKTVDVAEHKRQYPAWLERARPLLEAKEWDPAFKLDYPYIRPADTPWAPMTKPLAQCRLGLLSTAGVYVADDQPPFDAENIEGDWQIRELPADTAPDRWAIAHTHFPHQQAEEDINAVLPLDRLRELVAGGVIGGLASTVMSISGFCTRADMVEEHAATAVVARMKEMEVDAMLHIPV